MLKRKGQGSLEYLLLIGGAVLVAAIVIALVITSGTSTGSVTENRANCVNAKIQTGNSTTCVALNAANRFIQGPTATAITFTHCRQNNGEFQCGTAATSCTTVVTVC